MQTFQRNESIEKIVNSFITESPNSTTFRDLPSLSANSPSLPHKSVGSLPADQTPSDGASTEAESGRTSRECTPCRTSETPFVRQTEASCPAPDYPVRLVTPAEVPAESLVSCPNAGSSDTSESVTPCAPLTPADSTGNSPATPDPSHSSMAGQIRNVSREERVRQLQEAFGEDRLIGTVILAQVPLKRGGDLRPQFQNMLNRAASIGIPREQTVIIFDWDDTLLPSTWINKRHLSYEDKTVVPAAEREQLERMADESRETLRIAESLGNVVIVTNAEAGWIDLSCKKYMPSLYNDLLNYKRVSARTEYESQLNASPLSWKQRAFRKEIFMVFKDLPMDVPKSVLSFGDSTHERIAVISVTRVIPSVIDRLRIQGTVDGLEWETEFATALSKCHTKSIKLVERPSLYDLKREHHLLRSALGKLVSWNGDLDLYVKSVTAGPPPIETTCIMTQDACSRVSRPTALSVNKTDVESTQSKYDGTLEDSTRPSTSEQI